jgi:hypothetical protein
MKWEKWPFQRGEQYPISEVINECDARLREGGVVRRESKNEMVRLMEKYAPATVRWCPKTDRGWGASAFNKNCWRTVEGGPIIPQKIGQAIIVALNCNPCALSLTHQPSALSHSPAVTEGSDPMTVVSSRCPRTLTRRTQKPLSSLWNVTRSTSPEISPVVGLRSKIAAFIRVGIRFATDRRDGIVRM